MKVIKVSKQGYCNGVKRALDIVKNTIDNNYHNKQIYILGNIINNSFVSEQLTKLGVITLNTPNKSRLELLNEIEGDSIVVLTAHGVSPKIISYLNEKEITYVDATCPFVLKVSDRIVNYIKRGYDIIYLGKSNHPESEGVLGINEEKIHLVTNIKDIDNLNITNSNVLVDTQTTLSDFKTKPLLKHIKQKYPQVIIASGVCNATTARQQALIEEISGQLCLVVGDKISSNANELLEIGNQFIPTYLVNSINDIKKEWLDEVSVITLTSAASTPDELVDEIYNYLTKIA